MSMSYIINFFMQDVRLRPKCPLQWTQHKTKTNMSLTSRVKLVNVCLPLCFVAGNCSSKHVFGYLGINHIHSYLTPFKSSSCPLSQSWWSTIQRWNSFLYVYIFSGGTFWVSHVNRPISQEWCMVIPKYSEFPMLYHLLGGQQTSIESIEILQNQCLELQKSINCDCLIPNATTGLVDPDFNVMVGFVPSYSNIPRTACRFCHMVPRIVRTCLGGGSADQLIVVQ